MIFEVYLTISELHYPEGCPMILIRCLNFDMSFKKDDIIGSSYYMRASLPQRLPDDRITMLVF